MEPIVHISRSFEEADDWDLQQSLAMTPEERLIAARQLSLRYFGEDMPDVREYYKNNL